MSQNTKFAIEWRTRFARHWAYIGAGTAITTVVQTLFASYYVATGEDVAAFVMLCVAVVSGVLTLNAIDKRRELLREVEALESADA